MTELNRVMTVLPAADRVPRGVPLIAALTGFMDTGSTIAQLVDHFDDNVESEIVATFDLDEVYDYRARRPIISFDQDHLTDYEPPRLDVRLATDDLGSPFLLLTGVEPDFRWNAFVRAIDALVERFEV